MFTLKRTLLPLLLFVLAALTMALMPKLAVSNSAVETAPSYVAGKDYALISPPVHTTDSDVIEVVEFFWYGCGHCYNFEPKLKAWGKGLGDDVKVIGSPAAWKDVMKLHAKAFYTAEVLGVGDRMHEVIFREMNVNRKSLASKKDIAALFTANGVAAEDFDKAFDSFGVGSQVKQADSRMVGAKITGTPELMVNGKYRISARMAGSQAEMLKVAEYLIDKERKAGK